MIRIHDWKLSRCSAISEGEIIQRYDIAYVGPGAIDDRTNWTSDYLSKVSACKHIVHFDYPTATLSIDGVDIPVSNQIDFQLSPNLKILVDSTSLAFPEILYLFTIFNQLKTPFDVLYVQPENYDDTPKSEDEDLSSTRLSEDGMLGPKLLPRYVIPSRKAHLLALLGFEGHRLASLYESEVLNVSSYGGLIGIPGFKPGWENKTMYNNMQQISTVSMKDIDISGANDPIYTYTVIENKYKASTYARAPLFLAPLGTKPTSIAVANFAVNNPTNLSLVYDFVQKKLGRSSGTDTAHLWSFRCE